MLGANQAVMTGLSRGGGGFLFTDGFESAAWPVWNGATVSRETDNVHDGTYSLKSYYSSYAGGSKKSLGETLDSSANTVTVTAWQYRNSASNVTYIRIFGAADVGYMWSLSSNTMEFYRCNSASSFTSLLAFTTGLILGWFKHVVIFSSTGAVYKLYDSSEVLITSQSISDTTYQTFTDIGTSGALSSATTHRLDTVTVEEV